ncbi:MAG TPA: hypothetical protein DDY68_03010 [Porphyromonadaceae bacterium]|nr:hypothetical protein [Porphyromonadaceae bacterium]
MGIASEDRLGKIVSRGSREVRYLYNKSIDSVYEFMKSLGEGMNSPDFSFSKLPKKRGMDFLKIFNRLGEDLKNTILKGEGSSFDLSKHVTDELIGKTFKDFSSRKRIEEHYYDNTEVAKSSFLKRLEKGLNLSERVWRYAEQFKGEVELGIETGIASGDSAKKIAKDLKGYLLHPDKLFRRVRDGEGGLKLSKMAKEYHSGRGVYRSSFKNASD